MTKHKAITLLLTFPLFLISMAVGKASVELTIATAASLRDVFPHLKMAYERQSRGVTLTPIYGSSGLFATQITQGAPFDVLLAADQTSVNALLREGKTQKKDSHIFAQGKLAIWINPSTGLNLKQMGLKALKSPKIQRLVLANPALAPYGRAAQEVLKATGNEKICPGQCLLAQDAGQAALMLQSGGVDAGFIPLSLVKTTALGKKGTWMEIPSHFYRPLPNTAVLIQHPKGDNRPNPALARAFIQWLTGKTAQNILHQAGF